MKFTHPQDTKIFILGVIASMSAVILWDIIKDRKQIFNFKNEIND
tara:strand:+ start:2099 stop:2233 length:135 start_codon:yes stop_codon:yes gene_type:complete